MLKFLGIHMAYLWIWNIGITFDREHYFSSHLQDYIHRDYFRKFELRHDIKCIGFRINHIEISWHNYKENKFTFSF